MGDVVLFRAEHKEKQHDEDDGEADKKSRVDDLLHPEDDDLCFWTHRIIDPFGDGLY